MVLTDKASDVIKDPGEVFRFVKTLYDRKLVEVHKGYFANPVLCRNIRERAWVLERLLPSNLVVCVDSANWVYNNQNFINKLVLHHDSLTCITDALCLTDHSVFREDIIDINGLRITCPERTLIDMIRFNSDLEMSDLISYRDMQCNFSISEEKILDCLSRIRGFKNYVYIANRLYKYGFISKVPA